MRMTGGCADDAIVASSDPMPTLQNGAGRRGGRTRRTRALLIGAVALAIEVAAVRRRGYPFGGRVVVRCRAGHLFTTIWIPGASVKALRLGPWRLQRCPVGRHWTIVAPVDRAELGRGELHDAAATRDVRLP
jgi:hypothetical protein